MFGVAGEVAEEAADLVAVDFGWGGVVWEVEVVFDVRAAWPFVEPFAEEAGEVGGLADGEAAAGEGEELLDEVLGLEAGGAGGVEFGATGGSGGEFHFG